MLWLAYFYSCWKLPRKKLYNALLMEELASSFPIKCSQENILNQNLSFSCDKCLEEHFESFCYNSLITVFGSTDVAYALLCVSRRSRTANCEAPTSLVPCFVTHFMQMEIHGSCLTLQPVPPSRCQTFLHQVLFTPSILPCSSSRASLLALPPSWETQG